MNIRGKEFNVMIADVLLHVFSSHEMELEDGYVPFLGDATSNDRIEVECIQGIPAIQLDAMELLFEARNEQQKFYSIYKHADGYCFAIYNQQTVDEIQQIAYLNPTFNYWKVYSETEMSLKYPMGPIIMHYLTLYVDAVLMHASCAFDGQKARMFSGFSGAGKSTISGIWARCGAQIINDDRLVIRQKEGRFFVYNTPMYYVDQSKKRELNAIYLIKHSPTNEITKLSGAGAVSRVMAFCIQNNFDRTFVERRLRFFSQMCEAIPVAELGFVPTEAVVDFIKQHES